jgi:uncharacterized protein DUF6766
MRQFVRENSLSLFFLTIFLLTLVGQSFAGQHKYNALQVQHDGTPVSWWSYVTSSGFGSAVMENWQSEFLQFSLFIAATIWLVQRGSNESKPLEDAGLEPKTKQEIGRSTPADGPRWARFDDWRTRIYENSLLLVMTAIFFATWFAQSLNNWREFNDDARQHGGQAIGWTSYLGNADFWERTLQNWQSEFLAVGTMVVFTIYLRQRGSPESKPVGAPHRETGSSG